MSHEYQSRNTDLCMSQSSPEDTISILRGIKDKYEQHHGVRILDTALVSATMLSHRYITQRFLPDKAIDLMDEACANVRVQLDSQPEVRPSVFQTGTSAAQACPARLPAGQTTSISVSDVCERCNAAIEFGQ